MVRKTRSDKKDTISPIQVIQEVNQQSVKEANQEYEQLPTQTPNKDTKDNEQRKKQDKGKNQKREKPKEEEADRWVNPNAQKPGEHYKLWEARLHKRWVQDLGLGDCKRPENLNDCKLLCHDLDQYDPKAYRLSTKNELEKDEK
ncbi:unnamed protein product [Rhizophagus irregularis]|nr:unnamed protein product [Rhizophagus irregularis]